MPRTLTTMTESPENTSRLTKPGKMTAELESIAAWLSSPAPLNASDELPSLLGYLDILRAAPIEPAQRNALLDRLHERTMLIAKALLPLLCESALPIPVPRKTRPIVRQLQSALQSLADDLLAAAEKTGSPTDRAQTFLKSLQATARHLSTSHLTAAPAAKGLWQQLHRTYDIAAQGVLADQTQDTNFPSLKKLYFSTLLLGCAQPASFTSREIDFIDVYLGRFLDQIDFTDATEADEATSFWIGVQRDAPPTASARKPPPADTDIRFFSCAPIVLQLHTHLDELEAGQKAALLGLPEFAESAAGRGVIRRLINYWGDPVKRRFPRRRQNYRAVLCLGLDNIWRLFRDGGNALVDTSTWMITNESPDGYAVMHVSGKTGTLSVGDVLAIRTESGDNWQTCVVRWALSENQEHLELGLQILSTQGMPAVLSQRTSAGQQARLPVLVLPRVQALRGAELLITASGALTVNGDAFVLVIEKGNIEIREARNTGLEEQNSLIEVYAIEPVNLSA